MQNYFDPPDERGVVSITHEDIKDVATVLSQEPCYFREIIRKVNLMRTGEERGTLNDAGISVYGNGSIQPGVVSGVLLHLQYPDKGTGSMPPKEELEQYQVEVDSFPEVGAIVYRSFQIFVMTKWLEEEAYARKLERKKELIIKASELGFASAQRLEVALGSAVKRVFGGFNILETGINEPKPDILIPALSLCFEISARNENKLDRRYIETKARNAKGYKTVVIGQDFTDGAVSFAMSAGIDLIHYPREAGIHLNSKEDARPFLLLGRNVHVTSLADSTNELEKIVSEYHLISLPTLREYLQKNIALLRDVEKFFRLSSKEIRAQIRKARGERKERLKHELVVSERQKKRVQGQIVEFREAKEKDLKKLYYEALELKLSEIQYLSGLQGAITRYFPKRKDWREKIHETRVAVSGMRRQLKAYLPIIEGKKKGSYV